MEEKEQSEFGKGFTYCLGLFLAHSDRIKDYKKMYNDESLSHGPSMWFNGAADHLFEFCDDKAPLLLRKRCEILKSQALEWRLDLNNACRWSDVEWALQEAKDILLEYDQLCGFEVEKGRWE